MHLLAKSSNRTGISEWPGKGRSISRLFLSGCLLFTCLVSTAYGEVIVVLDEDFETDPPNSQILLQQTGLATASFEYGDVETYGASSRGLTFKGTYQTVVEDTEFDFANGILSPVVLAYEDYHLYPTETDGVSSISVSFDAIVEGLPSDNGNSNQRMGIGLQLWQSKDGQWDIYEISKIFDNLAWGEIGWTDLTAEDFMRPNGTKPDFSPTAQPIAFGFFVGIGYAWVSGPGQFISTSARVDNWMIEADVGLTIFEDGFEQTETPAPF